MTRLLVAVVAGLCVLVGSGCSTGDGGEARTSSSTGVRPVTTAEADRLAVARFNNFDRRLAPFTMSVPIGDQTVRLEGRVDFVDHRAVAGFATDDGSAGTLSWDFERVALLPGRAATIPQSFPSSGWQVRAMSQEAELDRHLALLLQLAVDRPENPQLLRQNGAQWVGATNLRSGPVDLMRATAPREGRATTTYYVDATGRMLRVDVTSGAPRVATITLPDGAASPVPAPPTLPGSAPATTTP